MKLKILFVAAMMTVATAVSVSAMTDVKGNEVYADERIGGVLSNTSSKQASMLAVSVNDTIKIDVTGVNGSLTLLAYKNGVNPSPDNIQYIRQYTPDENNAVSITFKIREIVSNGSNVENGLYCVKLNDGANDVKTLYYKVGEPVVVKGTENGVEVEYWQKVTFDREDSNPNVAALNTTSVAYKANFTLNGGCVNEYGFTAVYEEKTGYASNDDIDFSGAGDFSFGVTIHSIPRDTDLSKLKVVPFVNYTVDNTAAVTE